MPRQGPDGGRPARASLAATRPTPAAGPFAAAAPGVLGAVYFFWGFWSSGLAQIQGNAGDGALVAFISQHWTQDAVPGLPWDEVGIFYPAADTLAFSDTLFLLGLAQVPLVAAGISHWLTLQWVLVAMSIIGYVGLLVLLRIGPRAGWPIAIGAASVFAFGNGVKVSSHHPRCCCSS